MANDSTLVSDLKALPLQPYLKEIVMKLIFKTLTLGVLVASSSSVIAGEFFIGVMGGQSNFSELSDACDELIEDNRLIGGLPVSCRVTEDSDTVVGINAGYNFNRFIGLEAGYLDLGEYEAEFTASRITVSALAELDLAYAGLVLTAPFNDAFSVSARVGGVNANAEVSSLGFSLEIEDETTAFVGASVDYRFTENLSFQLRYDDLDVVDITTAGLRYHF